MCHSRLWSQNTLPFPPPKKNSVMQTYSGYKSYLILHEVPTVQAQTLRCIVAWPFPKVNILGHQSNTLSEYRFNASSCEEQCMQRQWVGCGGQLKQEPAGIPKVPPAAPVLRSEDGNGNGAQLRSLLDPGALARLGTCHF